METMETWLDHHYCFRYFLEWGVSWNLSTQRYLVSTRQLYVLVCVCLCISMLVGRHRAKGAKAPPPPSITRVLKAPSKMVLAALEGGVSIEWPTTLDLLPTGPDQGQK